MRTTLPLSVATATLMALSCSSGGPKLCAGSEAIPQQSVNVGEDGIVATCFEDPSGGILNYSASSGDASIVEAFTRGSNVVIRGVSPGQATVTATATNENEQSESVTFQVLSVNLPPIFTDSVTEDEVGVGRVGVWELYQLFEEPGDEEMTFEATSDFPGLAVVLTDSLAFFAGTSAGQARVTLTATDPHGDEASGTISVTVWEPEVVFEDDFATDASLEDWEECGQADRDDTDLRIENGVLSVEGLSDGWLGCAIRSAGGAEEFEFTTTMRLGTGALAPIIWTTGATPPHYRLYVGSFTDDRNWILFAAGTDSLETLADGNASGVVLDQFVEYRVAFSSGILIFSVDGDAVATLQLPNTAPAIDALYLGAPYQGVVDYDDVIVTSRPGSAGGDTADKRERPHEIMFTLPVPKHH